MSELLETRTASVDDSIRLLTRPDASLVLTQGQKVIAIEDPQELLRMGRWAIQIAAANPPLSARIAHIGAGTCVFPRVCNLRGWASNGSGKQDIYELRQSIVTRMTSLFPQHVGRWNFIVGDYQQTLTGTYHIIIYDIDVPPNLPVLNAHLAPGGQILGVD